jgi:hypothetical protein
MVWHLLRLMWLLAACHAVTTGRPCVAARKLRQAAHAAAPWLFSLLLLQVVYERRCTRASDVFSYGVMAWQVRGTPSMCGGDADGCMPTDTCLPSQHCDRVRRSGCFNQPQRCTPADLCPPDSFRAVLVRRRTRSTRPTRGCHQTAPQAGPAGTSPTPTSWTCCAPRPSACTL